MGGKSTSGPLSRKELDKVMCETPGCRCSGQMLRPACHADAGFLVEYEAGRLILSCVECHDHIVDIAVALQPEMMN